MAYDWSLGRSANAVLTQYSDWNTIVLSYGFHCERATGNKEDADGSYPNLRLLLFECLIRYVMLV